MFSIEGLRDIRCLYNTSDKKALIYYKILFAFGLVSCRNYDG